MKIIVIFLLLFFNQALASDEWTDADTKREAVYLALHFIDYKQTLAIPDRCKAQGVTGCYELNPILGKYPSKDRVGLYFAGAALLLFAIADALPAEYRKAFQYLSIGNSGVTILHNWYVGIEVRF